MSVLLVAGWLIGWVLLWRIPQLHTTGRNGPGPLMSVVIPVRNEVDRIPLLLGSLQRQSVRPDQIVVVDDGSVDGTVGAVRAFGGVELLQAGPVPADWTGKSWACATGVGVANGALVVFLDADVVLGEYALEQLVHTWSVTGDCCRYSPPTAPCKGSSHSRCCST